MKTLKQKQLTQQQLEGRRASQRKYYKKVTGVCIKFRADRPGKDQNIYALMQLMGPKKAINEMYGAYMEKLMREASEHIANRTPEELADDEEFAKYMNFICEIYENPEYDGVDLLDTEGEDF